VCQGRGIKGYPENLGTMKFGEGTIPEIAGIATLTYLQTLPKGHPDLPSPRVCRLLLRLFEGWRAQPKWISEDQVGHLFRGRKDLTTRQKEQLSALPIEIRKAKAIEQEN
jgi:hypothetical protein